MTKEELINDVQMQLTMSNALPKVLPDLEIIRIIDNEATPWFHEQVKDSLIKEYLYVPSNAFIQDQRTGARTVKLPCNIQNVVWVYRVDDRRLFELGVSSPNLSANMSYFNGMYMSSYLSTIGELGIYKVVIDSFSDMLNQLSKHTIKYDFNKASKDLHILTSMSPSLTNYAQPIVLEVYSHIPDEDLYDLDHFRRYVRAKAGMQLGRLYLRYDFQLPGGVKINSGSILSEAKEEMEKILEEIKSQRGNTSFFYMVKR